MRTMRPFRISDDGSRVRKCAAIIHIERSWQRIEALVGRRIGQSSPVRSATLTLPHAKSDVAMSRNLVDFVTPKRSCFLTSHKWFREQTRLKWLGRITGSLGTVEVAASRLV